MRHWVLAQVGGVWVDASVFPLAPLSTILPEMVDASGFAAFARSDKRAHPVATWFLSGGPGSELTTGWWREVEAYWWKSRRRLANTAWTRAYAENPGWFVAPDGGARLDVYPYFWSHHLFDRLLGVDATARALWQSRARPDALTAMAWSLAASRAATDQATAAAEDLIATFEAGRASAMMQKFDHRVPLAPEVLGWLKAL